jgi:ubiquinone/menaquinone biosynthesis C-methylase UbiE
MFQWHKEAERKWDERADFWNQNSQEMWDHGSRSTIIPFLKERVEPCHVVDAGCGDGYGSYLLSQHGYQVTGIDLSMHMIEKAKKREHGNDLHFVQGDVSNLPFQDGEFGAVMAINSLEWTKDPLSVLNEFSRVLNDKGYLCIGILGPTAMPRKNSYQRLYGENVICNTMMPWELERLATENGYTVVDGHGVYKREVTPPIIKGLSTELKQALTFMWVYIFQKND